MYGITAKRFMAMLFCGFLIGLTACSISEQGEEDSASAADVRTPAETKITEAGTTEANTFYASDTTDYAQYYDDTPNTAEPRTYTEDEIELDITEDKYVSCVNDIYVYTEDYLGKMIRIEGIYLGETFEGRDYHYIYRHGPGCCDTDGEMCGFEFTYNGDMPKNGDWIEVVGTLRQYLEGNLAYLTLDAISVTIKDERGQEDVKE